MGEEKDININLDNLRDFKENIEKIIPKRKTLTQAEYDMLSEEEKHNDTVYFISDGIADISQSDKDYIDSRDQATLDAAKKYTDDILYDNYQKFPEQGAGSLLNSLTDIQCDQTYSDYVEVYLDLKATNEDGRLIEPTDSNGCDLVGATSEHAGVLTAADKVKLDGIEEEANKYELPTAGKNVLGGVKTTSTVTSTSGHTACPIISGVPYYKNYSNATTSANGLMSADDKIRLNNLSGMTYMSGQVPINSSSGVLRLDGGYYYIISLTTSNPPHSLWLFDNVINYNPYNGGVTKITGYSNDVKVRVATMDAYNDNSGIVIEGCDHSSTTYKIYKLPF